MDYIIETDNYYSNGSFKKGFITVKDGRISDILLTRPKVENAKNIDMRGRWLMPGLINTHVHLELSGGAVPLDDYYSETDDLHLLRSLKNTQTMLYSGVTTVRDGGGSWKIFSLLDRQMQELYDLPRLILSGPPITVTGGHLHFFGIEADSDNELIKSVRKLRKHGAKSIKLIVDGGQLTPNSLPELSTYRERQIKLICDEAEHFKLPTFAHVLTFEGFKNALAGGVTSLEHCAFFEREEHGWLKRVFPELPDDNFAENIACSKAYNRVFEKVRERKVYFMKGLSAAIHSLDKARSEPSKASDKEKFLLEQEKLMFSNFIKLINVGMIPVVGTDAGIANTPFDETYLELELMQSCGVSAEEAIASATVNAAEAMNLSLVTGRIEKDLSADLIALDKNPLKNLDAFRNVPWVMAQGKIVKSVL